MFWAGKVCLAGIELLYSRAGLGHVPCLIVGYEKGRWTVDVHEVGPG